MKIIPSEKINDYQIASDQPLYFFRQNLLAELERINTVVKALALNTANIGLSPGTTYGIQSIAKTVHKAKSKPCSARCGQHAPASKVGRKISPYSGKYMSSYPHTRRLYVLELALLVSQL